MTENSRTHVIWDFPIMIFNKGAKKFRTYLAERESKKARWLNG